MVQGDFDHDNCETTEPIWLKFRDGHMPTIHGQPCNPTHKVLNLTQPTYILKLFWPNSAQPTTVGINKNVHQWDGRLSTHMSILRLHGARLHERRISSVTFMTAHLYGNVYMPVGVARALADSSDIGLLGELSSQKCEIPCLGRR